MNQHKHTYTKTAILMGLSLSFIFLICILWIIMGYHSTENAVAHIYQGGKLIQTIPLHSVTSNYTFVITGGNGCQNEIEVRPGSIGIVTADCPDKLCVHRGFISTSRLPITCLPNHLVIQIESGEDDFDMITY